MKFLWLLLWNPVEALDWSDGHGHNDHGKVVSGLVIFAILLMLWFSKGLVPSLGHTITLVSGAFGARVWLAFLRSRSVTLARTEARTETREEVVKDETTRQIIERRNPDEGTEPS